MQSSFTPMPVEGAEKMFNACSRKIPEFEEYLAQQPSGKQRPVHPKDKDGVRSVSVDNNDYVRRRGIVSAMPENGLKVINYDEGGEDAHAVIIIKNQYLPHGWGFFDANGSEDFRDNILVFRKKVEGVDYDVTEGYLTATPEQPFNVTRGRDPATGEPVDLPEDYNPGFCGIFGIMFMVFYKANLSDPEWVTKWQEVCKCFLDRRTYPNDPYKYKFSLVVAREALAIVNQNIPLRNKEANILQLISDACANKSGGSYRPKKRRRKTSRGNSGKGVRKRSSRAKSKKRSRRTRR